MLRCLQHITTPTHLPNVDLHTALTERLRRAELHRGEERLRNMFSKRIHVHSPNFTESTHSNSAWQMSVRPAGQPHGFSMAFSHAFLSGELETQRHRRPRNHFRGLWLADLQKVPSHGILVNEWTMFDSPHRWVGRSSLENASNGTSWIPSTTRVWNG